MFLIAFHAPSSSLEGSIGWTTHTLDSHPLTGSQPYIRQWVPPPIHEEMKMKCFEKECKSRIYTSPYTCLFWASMTVTWENGKGMIHLITNHESETHWTMIPWEVLARGCLPQQAWGPPQPHMDCVVCDRSISFDPSLSISPSCTHPAMQTPHSSSSSNNYAPVMHLTLSAVFSVPNLALLPNKAHVTMRGLCREQEATRSLFAVADATNSQC
jgi:hypothetical protein